MKESGDFTMVKSKKVNLCNLLYAAVLTVGIGMLAVPVYAGNDDYNYTFYFEGGNIDQTGTAWKESTHATTVTCTGCEGTSSSAFSSKICSVNGGYTGSKSLYEGRTAIFYDAHRLVESGVYVKAWLNSDDTDTYWGTWNPDNYGY